MSFIYVLHSKKTNKRYIGYTDRDVQQRLREHNAGYSRYDAQHRPFELLHVQECFSVQEARDFERFLKSGQGRQCLDELDF